jgi:hypothetical protein
MRWQHATFRCCPDPSRHLGMRGDPAPALAFMCRISRSSTGRRDQWPVMCGWCADVSSAGTIHIRSISVEFRGEDPLGRRYPCVDGWGAAPPSMPSIYEKRLWIADQVRHDDSAPPGTSRIRRLLGWTAQRHLVPKLSCHTPTKDRPDEVQAPRDRHVQARGTSKPVFTVHCADEQERPVLGANAGAPRWKASLPARMQPRWSWRPVVAPTIAAGCCTNRGIGFAWAR